MFVTLFAAIIQKHKFFGRFKHPKMIIFAAELKLLKSQIVVPPSCHAHEKHHHFCENEDLAPASEIAVFVSFTSFWLILVKCVSNICQCMVGIFTSNQVPLVSPAVIILFTVIMFVFSSLEAAVEYWEGEERQGRLY